jgi:hypothetical protein
MEKTGPSRAAPAAPILQDDQLQLDGGHFNTGQAAQRTLSKPALQRQNSWSLL